MSANARIESRDGALAFYSPYDPEMVADFKLQIPAADRRWDAGRKCWLVALSQLTTLERLCDRHGLVAVKQLTTLYDAPSVIHRIIQVDYIGAAKRRADGSVTAMGNSGGDWNIVFPQDVLRGWFELGIPSAPTAPLTHYAALNVRPTATPEEIKRGYRSMAKRWHPDVNRDPDATTMFKQINAAYEALSDPQKRRRYDTGLAFEASLKQVDPHPLAGADWRPPVRCGQILVEGEERLGRIIVSRILAWQPIVDARGRELVTSWPMGADTWLETWV